jgi:hypothetical protein
MFFLKHIHALMWPLWGLHERNCYLHLFSCKYLKILKYWYQILNVILTTVVYTSNVCCTICISHLIYMVKLSTHSNFGFNMEYDVLSKNTYVEVPTLVTIFEKALKRWLSLNDVMCAEHCLHRANVFIKNEKKIPIYLFHVKIQQEVLSTSQEESPQWKLNSSEHLLLYFAASRIVRK